MTPTKHQYPLSDSPSTDGVADGFTGVFPSAARGDVWSGHSSRATTPLPLIVAQAHGILTGESSPSWPEFGSAFFAARHPQVQTVNTEYYELPLPRLAAIRNPKRSRNLVRRMLTAAQYGIELRDDPAELAFVSHSNGAVLALQACRALIAQGVAVKALVMIAPAVRTTAASREVAGWLDSGMLEEALLVRPTRDIVIGTIGRSWRTKITAWPWGSLGSDGWDVAEFENVFPNYPMTTDLPDMGHTDVVAPAYRRTLYETIIAPALGLVGEGIQGFRDSGIQEETV